MNKKKLKIILLGVLVATIFAACRKDDNINPSDSNITYSNEDFDVDLTVYEITSEDLAGENADDHEESGDYTWESADVIDIQLNGTSIIESTDGASVDGTTLTISSAGTYRVSGTLDDGKVIIDTEDEELIRLIFNGVNISSSTNAPVFIKNAEKTVIVLADNTQNYLTDATTYVYESADEDEPNAALFSKDDLSIYGKGTLTVNANYNDGITSKDGLVINSGTIVVNSVDDGIRGKDYLVIKDGTININADGDGLKSDNDEDTDMGYISIEKGAITIVSGDDAIQAETDVIVTGGQINITSGGGSSIIANDSAKGIKAGVYAFISGESFSINSSDDAVHSNQNMIINGGTFTISTGDDGFHADSALIVNAGDINISESYEGLESALLLINDGTIHVVSSDDGLNVAGGNDGSGMGGPMPGGSFSSGGTYYLVINGGYIVVDADGDGIDANGSVIMTDGTVLVNGPTGNSNGALDYDGYFDLTGGFLVAAGSSGMAEAPSSSSSQYAVLVNFNTTISANTIFHIESADGEEIVSFVPTKRYQSVAFSSSKLKKGTSYKVFTGGSSTGVNTDGLYSNGEYTAGTQYKSFTISGIISKVN